ncbi:hypothetical protein GOV08_05025 [Candidatus Woesearchaeota archaeon]|nr:hypothetical protein [Candidatus Woesearchaeota archaeon]
MKHLKKTILGSIIVFSLLTIIHTIFVSQQKIFLYKRLRDVIISVLVFSFAIKILILSKRDSKKTVYYIIIANLLIAVFTIHLLRLFFGGLLC